MAQHRENRAYPGARDQHDDSGGQRWRPGEHEESQRGGNWPRGSGQDRYEDWGPREAWPSEAAGQGGPWESQGYSGQGGGYGQSGQGRYRQGGYGQGGYRRSPGQGEYGQGGWQDESAGSGHGQGFGRGGYGQGGSGQGQGGQGSYGQGGYDQGSFGQGSYGQGSYGPGSYGQGSYGQGSYGQGGYGQGQGSYGQAGSGTQDWSSSSGRGAQRWGRGPKGYKRSDERLKEDICERLMQSYQVDAGEVSVEVQTGKVTLDGTVPERRMKHVIEDIVDACPGVQDIDNRVRVARGDPSASANDSGTGTGSSASSATGTYGAPSSRTGTGSKKE
jgi:osmotically-inducible protein OsmY